MEGGRVANVVQRLTNIYESGNRINSVCRFSSTEEIGYCLQNAITPTRTPLAERTLVGQDPQGSGGGGEAKMESHARALASPPQPLALFPRDSSINKEGRSLAMCLPSLFVAVIRCCFRRLFVAVICCCFRRLLL